MTTLKYKVENQIGYLTLNIPEKLNAFQAAMKVELAELLREIRADSNVRALVITGEGRAFCAGGDVSTMGDKQKNNEGRDRMRLTGDWVKELMELEKPVIAAVNGYAFGGGLSLALACDFIIASEKASFQCSFVNISLVPDMALAWVLPKRIGLGRAKMMAYTGCTVKAAEAMEMGLVDQVVPAEELMNAANELALRLAKGPTYAIGLTKSLFLSTYHTSFHEFMEKESNLQAAAFHTQDHVMAVNAFLNKEEKVYSGK